jgi:hypothetical protein
MKGARNGGTVGRNVLALFPGMAKAPRARKAPKRRRRAKPKAPVGAQLCLRTFTCERCAAKWSGVYAGRGRGRRLCDGCDPRRD